VCRKKSVQGEVWSLRGQASHGTFFEGGAAQEPRHTSSWCLWASPSFRRRRLSSCGAGGFVQRYTPACGTRTGHTGRRLRVSHSDFSSFCRRHTDALSVSVCWRRGRCWTWAWSGSPWSMATCVQCEDELVLWRQQDAGPWRAAALLLPSWRASWRGRAIRL
jgi:hypothetical protein